MSQLSLPFRIALIAVLAIGALTMLVIKPGGDKAAAPAPASAPAAATAKAPSAPGMKGLTTAVDKAKGAAAGQAASDSATQRAADAASAGTAPAAAAKPAVTAAAKPAAAVAKPAAPATKPVNELAVDPSASILSAVDRGGVAVVLFAGRTAADDRAVRAAVSHVSRDGGKVAVRVVPIAQVGRYEAITRGVKIDQAPTVLVIGKDHTARTLVGFTTAGELNQLVADVRHGR